MYVRVRVTPASKKESVSRVSADHLEISVREPAKGNAANHRMIELVAREFSVHTKRVRLIAGHRSPAKIVDIPD
ncbi:MAG: DUF167 domain-containing protein [Candidatus Vogelbacteria bacterium]|nr:DUF167 domain-containing protein [Candidatus Vogelbacteria bacterium]